MKGKWEVISNVINGKKMYIAGRLINADEPRHSGNMEYTGHYKEYYRDAELFVDLLNARKLKKKRLEYFKEYSSVFLYDFCNENLYFTHGSIDEYNKLFAIAKHSKKSDVGAYMADIVAIIWVCSDGRDDMDLINSRLLSKFTKVTEVITL